MIEKFALYDSEDKRIVELTDTEEEVKASYKTARIFRKMVNKEPLQMVKVSLTEEEYEKLLKDM